MAGVAVVVAHDATTRAKGLQRGSPQGSNGSDRDNTRRGLGDLQVDSFVVTLDARPSEAAVRSKPLVAGTARVRRRGASLHSQQTTTFPVTNQMTAFAI